MPVDVKRFRAAVIDGRAQSVRFKQQQLVKLHAALESSQSEIVSAICKDTNNTKAEAEIQYALTLKAVKEFYSSLDFKDLLETEYSIAKSKDNQGRRTGYGCAYIIPSTYNLFYSAIVPLAAAIAAGNCAVLEIKQTLSELNSVLRRLLTNTLDIDTFAIADNKDFDDDGITCVTFDGRPTEKSVTTAQNVKTSISRVVSVVDKTANLVEAAKELVRARFAFGGESPYAPDLVLVNEFCMKEFAQAVAQQTAFFVTSNLDGAIHKSTKKTSDLQKKLAESDISILASGSKGSVALVDSRESQFLTNKISEPVLFLHAISSMDDAIDFLNSSNKDNQLMATYLFAAPPAAKYLSQFINADLSYTNRIPVELLVGPAAPAGFTPVVQPRYSVEMFSRPYPELISSSLESKLLSEIVDGNVDEKVLKKKVDLSLKPMKEPEGGQFGFFEQGIMTGGLISLSTIVATVVVGTKYVYPAVAARLRR